MDNIDRGRPRDDARDSGDAARNHREIPKSMEGRPATAGGQPEMGHLGGRARGRDWSKADLAAARAACPNHLDFARLLPEADRLLG